MVLGQAETNLTRAHDAWNTGDLAGYLELYDDGIKLHGLAPEPMNKQQVRAFYEAVFAAFADLHLTFHDVLTSGDKICIRFTMSGTHAGEFMGVPPTGRAVAMDGITVLHMADGRCIERWTNQDMLGLLVQLGAVPSPA